MSHEGRSRTKTRQPNTPTKHHLLSWAGSKQHCGVPYVFVVEMFLSYFQLLFNVPNPYLYAVIALTITLIIVGSVLGIMLLSEAAKVGSLQAEVDALKASYAMLQSKYEELQSSYSTLESQYNQLQSQYNELNSEYTSLLSNYLSLQNQCQGTSISNTATLQIQAVGLTGVGSGKSATLVFIISNPSSSGIGINGFTLGSLSCVFNQPIQVPADAQGGELLITLTINNGAFTGVSGIMANGGIIAQGGTTASCSGRQTAAVAVAYSGYLITVSGQTYPFAVVASS